MQLAELERSYQQALCNDLMLAGASFADSSRVDIRGKLIVGKDCFIDVNVVFEGDVELADDVSIGPGCVITNTRIGTGTQVLPNTIVEGVGIEVGSSCSLGPFARIRPGSVLESGVKVGNFVETKKAHLGKNAKASHLAYLGDADIGNEVNIGAGTVTCNYDGVNKHPAVIGDDAFIGTNSTLVAPLKSKKALCGSWLLFTKKVDANQLAVGEVGNATLSMAGHHRTKAEKVNNFESKNQSQYRKRL